MLSVDIGDYYKAHHARHGQADDGTPQAAAFDQLLIGKQERLYQAAQRSKQKRQMKLLYRETDDEAAPSDQSGIEAMETAFCQSLRSLPDAEKYALVKRHKQPSPGYSFPMTQLGGCNRSFKTAWLEKHPWMTYSIAVDGAFCTPCVLFCTFPSSKGQFVI